MEEEDQLRTFALDMCQVAVLEARQVRANGEAIREVLAELVVVLYETYANLVIELAGHAVQK